MNQSLINQSSKILHDLKHFLDSFPSEFYVLSHTKSPNATVGAHVRHILEFYQCFLNGTPEGMINYDKRLRNMAIETNIEMAKTALEDILYKVTNLKSNHKITLHYSYEYSEQGAFENIESNVERELFYNIEHSVHHLALIKLTVSHFDFYYSFPEDFGIAASTMRNLNKLCAQ